MSGQLIFDENTLINGNIFKYESRLQSPVNKFIDGGPTLCIYFSQDENSSTVDRGTNDIDELFGKNGPLRYNEIDNFPLYGFGQANPENTEEQQIEDIDINGECTILPSTIVPKQYDYFIIKHIKMVHLFQVTTVVYDSMKQDGFYKISYRLITTSHETIQKLRQYQVIDKYHTEMSSIGTSVNPIIRETDFVTKTKVHQMLNKMINSYQALFYNTKHNCFLYNDSETGCVWFDVCANEFMGKHSLMNYNNSGRVIVLQDKLRDPKFPIKYNNSIFSWLELGAPERLLQRFKFWLEESNEYPTSSFEMWSEDVMIIQPMSTNEDIKWCRGFSYFDDKQLNEFLDPNGKPENDYEKLIWKFIHKKNITFSDVSLYTGDALLNSIKHRDIYLYTPIIIYIIRSLLDKN